MDRRDAIKALTGAGLFGGLTLGDASAMSDEEKQEVVASAKAVKAAREEQYQKELHELLRFYVHLKAKDQKALGQSAAAVPFASLPFNVYARTPESAQDLPEPQLNMIHDYVCLGYGPILNKLVADVATQLEIIPVDFKIVDKLTIHPRERVVSNRYVVDMEEPWFDMRVSALMLLNIVEGIWTEWRAKHQQAIGICNNRPLSELPAERSSEVTPIELYAEKKAYMLEIFGWSSGAGLITLRK